MALHLYLFAFLQFFSLLLAAQTYTAERIPLGRVTDSALTELSGMIASKAYPGKFWTHNDSGDAARIFLIGEQATLQGTYLLEGIDAVDVEDIARYEQDGKTYLVLADIGDNRAVREHISLYVFEEPTWNPAQTSYRIPRTEIRLLEMRYDDKARDAEALFIDPVDLQGYLISKRDFRVGLYPFQLPTQDMQQVTLVKKMELPMTFITAADIAKDGKHILIKNLTEIFYWPRAAGESIAKTLAKPSFRIAYDPEPQGEAICFGEESSVFYTVSERPLGLEAYLYRYTVDFND